MQNELTKILILSALIEAVITYLNDLIIYSPGKISMLFSLAFGILIAWAYKLDLPKYFKLKSQPYFIGYILTGILISRGSNYLHDFISKINSLT